MKKNNIQMHKDSELSHSMVHYLLTIHKLKEGRGFARVTDIAKDLGLTKGSVSTALNNLKKRNLVLEEEDCKFLNLTDLGHKEVHKILSSRTLLYYFLKDFIGVSEEVAEKDSCLMEHLMSSETTTKFFDFMKKLVLCCDEKDTHSTNRRFDFETTLNLCNFENAEDFVENQIGDKHLPS
jgi:DtxR family transcriptional regulator, Mn-dependent transcriptional regulator